MPSYKIAELSFGSSRWNSVRQFNVDGVDFEIQRIGVESCTEALKRMIERLRSSVDAIAISSLPTEIRFRDRVYTHRQALDIMSTPVSIPLCNGERLRELTEINGVTEFIRNGTIVPEDGIFFPIGLLHMEALSTLRERYGARIGFADLYAGFKVPTIAEPSAAILELTKLGLGFAQLQDLGSLAPQAKNLSPEHQLRFKRQIERFRYVWGDPALITLFARGTGLLKGREILATTSDPRMHQELMRLGAKAVHSILPKRFSDWDNHLSFPAIDACLRLLKGKTAALSLEEWQEILASETSVAQETRRYVLMARPSVQTRLARRATRPREKTPDFAFVVHSLSFRDLTRAPGLKFARKLPKSLQPTVERSTAKLPGFVYGHASGIISEKTGKEANGIIYALCATPRVMKEEPAEVTYRKIEKLCYHAAEEGAKLIGLGAYTKIVGDAGATINRMSPIPVTTGNSLSASATLWALHDTIEKMDLLKVNSDTGRVRGTATVIGATGSIGKVSAKLLAMAFDRVCLVAPKMDRLEDLSNELRLLAPGVEIRLSTRADDFASITDVLVTATSAFDQKIIDVELLKPGCVVCDCSRPLDFSLEDAIRRPDVLFIESGEVILPGANRQLNCDIGLPDNVVYACLGETAVLAMEGLYEPFTLGRDLDWQKVKKIYKLSREHGVRLAATRGPSGFISDREIKLTRELAIRARGLAL